MAVIVVQGECLIKRRGRAIWDIGILLNRVGRPRLSIT